MGTLKLLEAIYEKVEGFREDYDPMDLYNRLENIESWLLKNFESLGIEKK